MNASRYAGAFVTFRFVAARRQPAASALSRSAEPAETVMILRRTRMAAKDDANWWAFSIPEEERGQVIKAGPEGLSEVNPALPGGRRSLDYQTYMYGGMSSFFPIAPAFFILTL